jgi:RNA polymerase sigma-70 factor (ECF subfamily)
MLENEENLIRSAKGGDPEAFGKLYDEHHPRIYRFVLLKVSSREDAEDLTHQIFLNAWEHISGYRHQGFPFSSWLYRIARNAVIDHYRTRKEEVSVDDVDPEMFALSEDIQAGANRAMEFARVRRAIVKLSSLHQDVIIMRFVEELAIREVAAALKKSEGAVKLLQHRAITELQRILAEE